MTCENCRKDAAVQAANIKRVTDKTAHTTVLLPGEGHDGCKGCTCQHLPVGSIEFLGSDPSRSI